MIGSGLAGHLRYRREALGLTRKDAAKQIGVRGAAVGQWETGEHHPEAEYWPGVLRFIGCDPICPDPQTVPEKIAFLCRHKGVSRSGLAALLGIDMATVLKWERGMPQRKGWSKTARLDALVLSVKTGEPVAPEPPPRLSGLADALYRTRRERALSQEAVAGKLNVDPATYGLWESGKRDPHPGNWPGILHFLGFDPLCRHPKTIPEKIGAVRRRHGLTYRALGKVVGGSEHVVLRLEAERTAPSVATVAVLDMLLRNRTGVLDVE